MVGADAECGPRFALEEVGKGSGRGVGLRSEGFFGRRARRKGNLPC